MVKCKYTSEIEVHKGHRILCLEDLDAGRSLTNDIENVIDELIKSTPDLPTIIIYKDSDKIWDGWNNDNQQYIFLNKKNREDALDKIVYLNETL